MNSHSPAEPELIGRAQSGDVAAFQQLAEMQAELLCACAFSLCRDRHRAEDLVQETLVEVWRSLIRFDGRCRFSTWLYGILRHRYLKSRRRPKTSSNMLLSKSAAETLLRPPPTPAAAAEQSEDADRLRQAVAELPEEHRLVIELRFFAGARLEEIATLLDCPLGTVKSRLHNGLDKLRRMNLAVNLFPAGGNNP